MDKKEKRKREILNKIYIALYKEATPSADFNELYENAPWVNSDGEIMDATGLGINECVSRGWKKKIDYNNYLLEEEKYTKIVDKILNRHKLDDYDRNSIKIMAYLGCGPCFLKKGE